MKKILNILIVLFLCTLLDSKDKNLEELLLDLQSSHYPTRISAIYNLGILKDHRAIKPLEYLFFTNKNSTAYSERYDIVDALRSIGYTDAIESLIRMLKTNYCTDAIIAALNSLDPDWKMRQDAQKLFDNFIISITEHDEHALNAIKILPLISPEKALKPFLKTLTERGLNDNEIRPFLDGLGIIKSKETLIPLIEFFFDPNYTSFRFGTATTLDKINPDWRDMKLVKDKIPELLEESENPMSDSNKSRMIYSFEILRDNRAIPYLLRMIKENDLVKSDALNALAFFNDKDAKDAVLEALNDKEISLRNQLLGTIGISGLEYYCRPLIDIIRNKDDEARWAAIESIGKLKCSSALPALIEIIETAVNKNSIEDSYIKDEALLTIISISDCAIVPTLLKWLKQKKYYQDYLIYTLAQFNDKRIAESLIPLLEDATISLNANAIEILRKSDDPRALKLLQKALIDTDWETRAHAEWAIWNIQHHKTSE
ncbi:MAG: hypothetical protein A2Y62_13745 [Candidatus Fischerbacteria bacterium RBG_13_37_8]|uniref:HEAT repeat domain-containing protein n=1 Tax=Candidatus Fischerbacteria bacterium RBG_13_37_8 TaxID=1817863 RepID=A0A1F5V7D1_9BACT|nr:MAG: hypothetical protein A2Y62_13745 [Candidatus Fischerbacteria bacterium RBG_13_37_8]